MRLLLVNARLMTFTFLKSIFQSPTDLIIASQDRSGYVRERAVRKWATQQESVAVQFLIDRLGDWVPQVRSAAWDTLQRYMTSEYYPKFLERFYWIDRLLGKGNADTVRFGEELVTFVFSYAFSPEIERLLKEHDLRNWQRYVKHSIHRLLKTDRLLLETVCKDSSPSVRSAVIQILDDLQEDQREKILTDMICDHAQPIRSRSLYYIVKHLDRNGYEQKIHRVVADVSSSVREAARFYLREKITDWRSYYRECLDSDKLTENLKTNRRQTLGCLGGFAEFAVDTDVPLLEQIVQIEDNKAKTIVIEAIYRLNPPRGIALAKEFVLHHSGRLGHSCIRILTQNSTLETLAFARNLAGSQSSHLRMNGLRLLGKIGGWTIAADLLLATTDADKNVREMAVVLLNQWMCKYAVQGWIKPREEETYRVIEVVKLIRSRDTVISSDTIKTILFFFGVRDEKP